ncbi:hypothetical protein [Aquimarina intermedia]|uniref:SpoIIAA-like protein n=1 Tax=Aquimarina intermedia TaxID=350814 RepID=A0A5S5CB56_9FLAO|nr:hypothetical protein [Aquimarina intermedia]TYP75223.1 hypothetical protein BD809_103287 [Aquimarina intermedia]
MYKIERHQNFVKKYVLEFCTLYFFTSIVVVEVHEGVHFNYDKATYIGELTAIHFEKRPFGYISHRIHSYALEPMDYKRIYEIFPNLAILAVVLFNSHQETSLRVEEIFFQNNIMSFDQLDIAIDWVEEYMKSLPKLNNDKDLA